MVVILRQVERIGRLVSIDGVVDSINQLFSLRAVETDRDVMGVIREDIAEISKTIPTIDKTEITSGTRIPTYKFDL